MNNSLPLNIFSSLAGNTLPGSDGIKTNTTQPGQSAQTNLFDGLSSEQQENKLLFDSLLESGKPKNSLLEENQILEGLKNNLENSQLPLNEEMLGALQKQNNGMSLEQVNLLANNAVSTNAGVLNSGLQNNQTMTNPDLSQTQIPGLSNQNSITPEHKELVNAFEQVVIDKSGVKSANKNSMQAQNFNQNMSEFNLVPEENKDALNKNINAIKRNIQNQYTNNLDDKQIIKSASLNPEMMKQEQKINLQQNAQANVVAQDNTTEFASAKSKLVSSFQNSSAPDQNIIKYSAQSASNFKLNDLPAKKTSSSINLESSALNNSAIDLRDNISALETNQNVTTVSEKVNQLQNSLQVGVTNSSENLENTSRAELIDKVAQYIKSAGLGKEGDLTVKVEHKDLGQFEINVAKSGKDLDLNIKTANMDSKNFFSGNHSKLVQNLAEAGIKVGEIKFESSFTGENSFSGEKNSGSDSFAQSPRDGYNKQRENLDQDSQRRKELWQQVKDQRMAA